MCRAAACFRRFRDTMRARSLLSLLLILVAASRAAAIINCFDYAFYRATGVDPRPTSSSEINGVGFGQMQCYLKAMGYTDLGPALSDGDLVPGDVLLFGTSHAGFVVMKPGLGPRIDHYIQIWGSSGKKFDAGALLDSALYLDPRPTFPRPEGDKHTGKFQGHTLAQFMGSAFRPSGQVMRWRKTGAEKISARNILRLEELIPAAEADLKAGDIDKASTRLKEIVGMGEPPECMAPQVEAIKNQVGDFANCDSYISSGEDAVNAKNFGDAEMYYAKAQAAKCEKDRNKRVLMGTLRRLIDDEYNAALDAIKAKVAACEFESANELADKLRSYPAANALIYRDFPDLERNAAAQKEARQFLQNGLDALGRKDLTAATTALDEAGKIRNLPSCMLTKIADLKNAIEKFKTFSKLTEQVEKATEVCDYKEVARLVGEITRLSPREQYITDYLNTTLPKLAELQNKEKKALDLLRQADPIVKTADAESQKDTADWNNLTAMLQQASNLLKEADKEAPKCLKERAQMEALRLKIEEIAKRKKATITTSIILLIDASGSMGDNNKMEQAKAAARIAARQVSKTTEIAILRFSGGCAEGAAYPASPFTTDLNKLLAAIDSISHGGSTPMYIATAEAVTYAQKNGKGKQKSVVLLSDGADTCRDQKAEASATIRSSNIPVSTIGYDVGGNTTAQGDLGDIAGISGGKTFSASAADPREIIKAVRDAMLPSLMKRSDVSGPADAQFMRAQQMVEQKDIAGALMMLQQANQLTPNSPNLNFNLSLLYESQDQLIPAMNHANNYLRLAPGAIDSEDVRNRVADIQLELQKNPRVVIDTSGCRDVLAWAQAERDAARRAGNTARVQAALEILIAAQRGECDKARDMEKNYRARYR